MAKKRNLNGLPNNLIQQYFSTLFHYDKGYMADWIFNASKELQISNIEIDIINQTVNPPELQIKPITSPLIYLLQTIEKELIINGFESGFIVNAKFDILTSQKDRALKTINCLAVLVDKDGKTYKSKLYQENAYETDFTVFKPTIIQRLKNIFSKK